MVKSPFEEFWLVVIPCMLACVLVYSLYLVQLVVGPLRLAYYKRDGWFAANAGMPHSSQ